jgi:hypothetical protein
MYDDVGAVLHFLKKLDGNPYYYRVLLNGGVFVGVFFMHLNSLKLLRFSRNLLQKHKPSFSKLVWD